MFLNNISIHAAREGGDKRQPKTHNTSAISIHAAREGGDPGYRYASNSGLAFQSTPPVKAATQKEFYQALEDQYFNPRRP